MESNQTRGRGRPQTAILTRDRIVSEAIRLMDDGTPVSLASLAKFFGVKPSALYNHVSSKDDLYQGIRESLSEGFSLDFLDEVPWDEGIRRWARAYRRIMREHRPAIMEVIILPPEGHSVLFSLYNEAIFSLQRQGWPVEESLGVVWTIEALVVGHTVDEAAHFAPVPTAEVPFYQRAYNERIALSESLDVPVEEMSFELGLDMMLRGLRSRLAEIEAERAAAQ